ncbi:MAG TPA: amidohydrolase family protein [Woeseiaceae bacterium]|nr:amidohydrolase family protein [Woeseiaceae bacterium]
MNDEFTFSGDPSMLMATAASVGGQDEIPVIDTHVHIWDRTRPQGAPFPPQMLYGAATPDVKLGPWYRQYMTPAGIVGAIAVEASPWIEDNLWLLQACEQDTFLVGAIGNLRPETKEFPEYLDRYQKFPLFLGIRHGNLWGFDIVQQSTDAAFLAGLKLLADAGLVLETANPQLDNMDAVVRISDAVPELTIVITHLAGFNPPIAALDRYDRVLREIRQRPRIYGKISYLSLYEQDAAPSLDLADHKDKLDRLTEAFGEDRVVAGAFENRAETDLRVFREYYSTKPRIVAEKFFWRNSINAYKWKRREQGQPEAG